MTNKTSGSWTEKLQVYLNKPLGGPIVGMIARHPIFFIVPLLMFVTGLCVLYWGSIYCKDGWAKCLANSDKSSVAAGTGLIAASIALSSWLASFYREFDRQRFDLFNSLHKEFRTTEDFKAAFDAVVKMERLAVKDRHGRAVKLPDNVDDPFEFVDDQEAVRFAEFFEIIAISVQSDLMSAKIANYFFGNHLILALFSRQFKAKIRYVEEPLYWSLLRRFKEKMMAERDQMTRDKYAPYLRI
jgi:hypothetical protein